MFKSKNHSSDLISFKIGYATMADDLKETALNLLKNGIITSTANFEKRGKTTLKSAQVHRSAILLKSGKETNSISKEHFEKVLRHFFFVHNFGNFFKCDF